MPGAEYRQVWQKAFDTYVQGNWGDTKSKFEAFMELRPDCGSTSVVYSYMQNRNFTAPNDWKGYRKLTSK